MKMQSWKRANFISSTLTLPHSTWILNTVISVTFYLINYLIEWKWRDVIQTWTWIEDKRVRFKIYLKITYFGFIYLNLPVIVTIDIHPVYPIKIITFIHRLLFNHVYDWLVVATEICLWLFKLVAKIQAKHLFFYYSIIFHLCDEKIYIISLRWLLGT